MKVTLDLREDEAQQLLEYLNVAITDIADFLEDAEPEPPDNELLITLRLLRIVREQAERQICGGKVEVR